MTNALIYVNIVINWNSIKTVFLIILNLTFLTSLIILSHIPSIYGAAGGLKYQVIFFARWIPDDLLHWMFSLLVVSSLYIGATVSAYFCMFSCSIDRYFQAMNESISVIICGGFIACNLANGKFFNFDLSF